jgi:hypothetical protein
MSSHEICDVCRRVHRLGLEGRLMSTDPSGGNGLLMPIVGIVGSDLRHSINSRPLGIDSACELAAIVGTRIAI